MSPGLRVPIDPAGDDVVAKTKAAAQIKSWDDPFIRCRDIGHSWGDEQLTDERRKTGEVVRDLWCASCGAQRIDRVGAKSGEIYGRRYIYAEGYLAPKGQFKRGDLQRTEIRVEAIRRLLSGRSNSN